MGTLYNASMKTLLDNHALREAKVSINKLHFINSEVVLSSTLEIRSIKANSPAIHHLLIGDRIISVNGQDVNDPMEALLLVQRASHSAKGQTNATAENEFQDAMVELGVHRQLNKTPVSRLRLAYVFKQSPRSLVHPIGFHYFTVTLRRIRGIHLGFKVKELHGKLRVTEVYPNSIATHNYLIGDALLDINCEPVDSVVRLREILYKSMRRYGSCTTLVERAMPESLDTKPEKLDPQMAADVVAIGRREAFNFVANRNYNRHFLRPVITEITADSDADKHISPTKPDGLSPLSTAEVTAKRWQKPPASTPFLKKLMQKMSMEAATAKERPPKATTARAKKAKSSPDVMATTAKAKKGNNVPELSAEQANKFDPNNKDGNANAVTSSEAIRIGLIKFTRDKDTTSDEDAPVGRVNHTRSTPPRKRRHTIISVGNDRCSQPKHGEHMIGTDVADPRTLHKVKDSRERNRQSPRRSPKREKEPKQTPTPPKTDFVFPPLL